MTWRTAGLFFIALALGASGCDKSQSAQGTSAPALDSVTLGYFANVTHAQAVLGVASGDFQTALGPTQLKTKVFNAGPELIQALNAGAVDIGYVGPGPVLSADVNSNGQAVRVISGSAANGVVIVASKESGIHSLADLKGKRIATPQLGNTQDVSARHYVTAVLGQSDASNVKEIRNSQESGMMARGLIDAAWVPEPWGARLINETGAVLVGEEKDLWPTHEFSLTVIVTTPKFLAEHPDVIEKILTVHHEWTARLSAHAADYTDQLNDALIALGGKKLPEDVIRAALGRTEFTDDPLPETFKTMEQWSHDLAFIRSTPDLTGLFETSIIQRVASSQPARQH
ncbi:MAG TPA: aliphatic sulfonate ABC transporter substrate-binding protein [Tepidisphaeraceae bacterium]|jgi:NitT/TauT family transport system substrate-binding protein